MKRSVVAGCAFAALLFGSVATTPGALAAGSIDACSGVIDSATTINAPGIYCLDGTLAYEDTFGAAITVQSEGVVIDCNGHAVVSTSAAASMATGVYATSGAPIIRNCMFRGFETSVYLIGGGTVEDNVMFRSRSLGIYLQGGFGVVRRNRIVMTGPGQYGAAGMRIFADAEIVDNEIVGVVAGTESNNGVVGILVNDEFEVASSALVARNRISGLAPDGGYEGVAFWLLATGGLVVRDNALWGDPGFITTAFDCGGATMVLTRNVILGFADIFSAGCPADPGNTIRQ